MVAFLELLLAAVAVVLLFLASTVFFDLVHWRLHRMLASPVPLLRGLAWPHGIHHRWIDRRLRVRWEFQAANVWCHLVLEYLTQLAFTGLLAFVLPTGLTIGLVALQTVVFLFLLREQGLDLNHRPQPIVEVAPPMLLCPVAYHAQHHAYPDAFFSSYVKVVDAVLGTALDLPSLRIAFVGEGAFGRELRSRCEQAGAEVVVFTEEDRGRPDADILVLCDASLDLEGWVEPFLRAVGARQLPPEVWAATRPENPVARYYFRDRRFLFRPLLVESDASEPEAVAAARRALAFLRRGAHVPRTRLVGFPGAAFRRTRAVAPPGVSKVGSRRELAALAGS